ncbi:hypothetical protein QBC45DRAFT_429162 [Copromyces sp. CBS 386.78]|nr:hypothetical protein QBC45DRAFT_429162 [Copromyces sp. CBS 386.78]
MTCSYFKGDPYGFIIHNRRVRLNSPRTVGQRNSKEFSEIGAPKPSGAFSASGVFSVFGVSSLGDIDNEYGDRNTSASSYIDYDEEDFNPPGPSRSDYTPSG